MSKRIYLDWNATAPLRPQARATMLAALDCCGNPSSVHREGRLARRRVEEARSLLAALVGALPSSVVFTSGGTEANRLALTPLDPAPGGSGAPARLLLAGIEHPSVLQGGGFAAADRTLVAVTRDGMVDLGHLEELLQDGHAEIPAGRPLVSIMLANNETGVIQPVAEAALLVHAAGGLLHVDAVQAAGRIDIDMQAAGIDRLTVSAHKIGGPTGVGALICRGEAFPAPRLAGGGQEHGRRAGTENLLGIVGFGAAAGALCEHLAAEQAHLRMLQGRLEAGLLAIAGQTVIFGRDAPRIANTTLFAVPGIGAETALIALDLDHVAVSSGSACSSGKVAPSHVLAAMGVDSALARGALRVTTGYATTADDIDAFLEAWRRRVDALLKHRRDLAA